MVRNGLKSYVLRDLRSQLVAGTIALIVLLIASVAAWPEGSREGPALTTVGGGTQAGELPLVPGEAGVAERGRVEGGSSVSSAAVRSGSAGAPTAVDPRYADLPIGKGVTKTSIRLGIGWGDPASTTAVAKAIGASNFTAGPGEKKIGEAVIKYMNAHGGIAGRRIEPVWYEHFVPDTASSEGQARDTQSACATWTEDNQVFAYYSNRLVAESIVQCSIDRQTPMVNSLSNCGPWVSEQRLAEAGDYFYLLSKFSTQRRERAMAASLKQQGFFSPGARVGLLVEDSPSIRTGVNEGLKPALRQLGVNVVSEVVYPDFIESPWQNYVLQFQSQGVTHVIFSASRCEPLPVILFLRSAENQQYRPRYGISSDALVGGQMVANTPESQLQNARGFSMHPGGFGPDDFPTQSPPDALCRQIMKDGGLPETGGQNICDFMFFLKFALERARALTPEGLAATLDQLGTSWVSAASHKGASRFVPNRHQGIALVRDIKWNSSKNNFEYASAEYAVPP